MSVVPEDHTDEIAPGHDLAEEARHARHHAVENNWFFGGFFCLVGAAVLTYEFTPNSFWAILLLGALRFGFIGVFLFSLVRPFGLVVRSIAFTVFFFLMMIYLSMWGSFLPKVGDPIVLPHVPTHH